MKQITKVENRLYELFKLYLADKLTPDQFVYGLKECCKGRGKKGYWWRFFANDTGANDWQSVRASLGSFKNSQYLKECMEIALSEKQIKVYYS